VRENPGFPGIPRPAGFTAMAVKPRAKAV